MANDYIKATKVVNTALGVLEREIVLPSLVWRYGAVGDFKLAKDDTVTLRVPAYMTARTRTMRSGGTITIDDFSETAVDVTLDTHIYRATGITDEEMTLDIADFGVQILNPSSSAVARGAEDLLADEMENATYEVEVDLDEDDPYLGLVDARTSLNNASVPMGQRFLAVGSSVEAAILKSDRLSKFDSSGDSGNSALRENLIGRIAGFTAVSVPGLSPDIAVAGHQTAFVLSLVAPAIPQGVTWGQSASYNGLALRTLKDYDYDNIRDRLLVDTFAGTATVMDNGTVDSGDGKFVPDADESPILVRAVKCNLVPESP